MSTSGKSKHKTKADEISAGIVTYLQEGGKEELLPDVVAKLQKVIDSKNEHGEVITAVKLEKVQLEQIEDTLKKKLERPIFLKNKVRKDILGGLIIRFNDIVIDLSLKSQLDDIKNQVYN